METIKKIIGKTNIARIRLIYLFHRKYKNIWKTLIFSIQSIFNFYTPSKKLLKGEQIRKVFNKAKINIDTNNHFIYTLDVFKIVPRENRMIDNLTIDYSKVIHNSLINLKKDNLKITSGKFKDSQEQLILGIEEYINRICDKITKSTRKDKKKLINYFQNIKTKEATSFEEALQRILFFNQLIWQSGLCLNGLGRLDKILDKLYKQDIKEKNLTVEKAKKLIKDFIETLHQNFWFKSNSLLGDTGQIIILGGLEPNGKYFYNDLTYLFIEVLHDLSLPDPKILLRVAKNIPKDLMEVSLKCIQTGIGCPLFSNDDVIIPKLIDYGYDKKDAYNYATSACWEPFIPGKSFDQNNIDSIVYMEPFLKMIDSIELDNVETFEQFLETYIQFLQDYILEYIEKINSIEWEESPLLSLFTENCNKNAKDIAYGGAKYNHYGFTSVSLSNVVNSLYNIKHFVFDKKTYQLSQINTLRQNNYFENENIIIDLKKQPIRYGTDSKEIIELTNTITKKVNDILNNHVNKLGGKFKFGLSAPSYITKSMHVAASFDGRKNDDPFGVHISSDKASVAYTELIQFASKLDYSSSRFNGNVIDFMITPSFIENNFDKMVNFLILSISLGFFQMQMNVTSSDTLIKAKANPKQYENLIVRVWGFSAYFNDLPENYKNLLIERALKNEGKSI